MISQSRRKEQPVKPPKSIADQIYENLKQEIIAGDLEPGHRLYEKDIAETYKASRTPVREAFRRLEQDLLVERLARGGVHVQCMDTGAIQDLFSLRTVLETHAIELACQRINPQQIAVMKQIQAQAQALIDSQDLNPNYLHKRFVVLNSEFHQTIYEATGSKYLIKLLKDLRGILLGMRSISLKAEEAGKKAWADHSRLIVYLERGDQKAAVELTQEHVAKASGLVKSVMRSQEE